MSDLCEHGRRKNFCATCYAIASWPTSPQWSELFAKAAQSKLFGQYTAMSNQPISPGPHDFDVHRRICTRCGCTIGDWADGKARTCDQPSAPAPGGASAAADDFGAINKRLGEIEKEQAVASLVIAMHDDEESRKEFAETLAKLPFRCPEHGSFVLELDGTRHCNFAGCGWSGRK